MRLRLKQSATVLALYAVALHVILFGFAPPSAYAAPADGPFLVICHAQAAVPGDDQPVQPRLVPGHACDHCNLCNAVAPPAPPENALNGALAPARVLCVLRPVSAASPTGVAFNPNRARGPPAFA